ncbi:MAG: alpha/beta fold hydrolase [Pseudomonadota bacterium]
MTVGGVLGATARCVAAVVFVLVASSAAAHAEAPPPLSAYGGLPQVDLATLSPSGNRLALRQTTADYDVVSVLDLNTKQRLSSVNVVETNPRNLVFIDDDTLLIVAGGTARYFMVRNPFDYSAAFVVDVNTGKTRQLLQRSRKIYPMQSGLGEIVGVASDQQSVYMPAFSIATRFEDPPYSLWQVGIDKKKSVVRHVGHPDTIDWFLDADGSPLVREDYDNSTNLHTWWRYVDGKRVALFEDEAEIRSYVPVGVLPDRSALVFTAIVSDKRQLFTMTIETGDIEGPILSRDDRDIERVLLTPDRVLLGVEYSGFTPEYDFLDADLAKTIRQRQMRLRGTSARLESWSRDFGKTVFRISGGWNSGAFIVFTDGDKDPKLLAVERPGVPDSAVARTEIIEYAARDGLTIPALVTASKAVRENGKAPLVVLPHGGPESHDQFEFNWLTQFFASRGYVVLQPQFRGSDGFGYAFKTAGRGEWGGKMQTDLHDGVSHLAEIGLIDRERVCIVGASYGGYAAMAAAAFSDGIYRCAVAVNGVFDLRTMLIDERRNYGSEHWVVKYWERLYGADGVDKARLDAISPTRHAQNIDIPVLLIHGIDDTVVPIDQSRKLSRALHSADVDHNFVELKGEDHWLSYPGSRTRALEQIDAFLKANL